MEKMKTFSYTLAANIKDVTIDTPEIREFVEAPDIITAYSTVMSIIADINKANADYNWTLKVLENSYFVGIHNDHICDCDCDCDCDHEYECKCD